jgi:hypothetical protein
MRLMVYDLVVILCEVEVVVLLEVELHISIVLTTSIGWCTMAMSFYNWSNIVGVALGWESLVLVKQFRVYVYRGFIDNGRESVLIDRIVGGVRFYILKERFIKDYVSRNIDFSCKHVKTFITLMLETITNKNASFQAKKQSYNNCMVID